MNEPRLPCDQALRVLAHRKMMLRGLRIETAESFCDQRSRELAEPKRCRRRGIYVEIALVQMVLTISIAMVRVDKDGSHSASLLPSPRIDELKPRLTFHSTP